MCCDVAVKQDLGAEGSDKGFSCPVGVLREEGAVTITGLTEVESTVRTGTNTHEEDVEINRVLIIALLQGESPQARGI